MMHMDDKVEAKEQEIILSLVQQNFSLTAEQAACGFFNGVSRTTKKAGN